MVDGVESGRKIKEAKTRQFTNVTDGRTDRRHAIAIPRFALKCIAR